MDCKAGNLTPFCCRSRECEMLQLIATFVVTARSLIKYNKNTPSRVLLKGLRKTMGMPVRVAIHRNKPELFYCQIKFILLKTAIFSQRIVKIDVVSIYNELQVQTIFESLKFNIKCCNKYKILDHMSPCCGEKICSTSGRS